MKIKWNYLRAASVVLALAMLSTVLFGCSTPAPTGSGTQATDAPKATEAKPAETKAADPAAGTAATSGDRPKLLIGVQQNPNVEDYETNYLTKLTEEKNNVDLDFLMLPTDNNEFKTKFALMVTSNSELPDVVMAAFDDITTFDYAQKGIFVDITKYYDDPNVCKNITSFVPADKEYVTKNMKMADGKIYAIMSFAQFQWNEGCWRGWVNQDWLKTLNITAPKTTDEFTAMLKAFADKDPNGNGKKDEIAMVGSKDGWGQDPIVFLMNPFTYANKDKKYLQSEGGKIYASYTKPEWKEGLAYINQLVKDNLLSPLSFTQDGTALKAIATNEEAIAGVVPAGSFSTFNNVGPAAERMTLLEPLTGPNGACTASQSPSLPAGVWYITKNCKNVELAVSVGDFFLSDEMSLTCQSGEKGVNWTDDQAVAKEWVGRYQETPTYVVYPDLNPWGKPGNIIWQAGPRFERWEFRKGQPFIAKKDVETNKIGNWNQIHLDMYIPKFPTENIGRLVYVPEEIEKIGALEPAIWEFVQTATVEFATGNRPLSDYDNFLKELDGMGFQEYLTLVQSAYDRAQQ